MKTLLRIDSSIRKSGSHSRGLADHFQARWSAANPDGRVCVRDLASDPVPHLDEATVAAFFASDGEDAVAAALSSELIAELEAADELLISSPLYNFNLPSTLKSWLDHVTRSGHTFELGPGGHRGLLDNKRACVITTRGGTRSPTTDDDFQTPYLKAALSFIGVDEVELVRVEGLAGETELREAQLARARRQIERVVDAHAPVEPEWIGPFSAADRSEISALRQAQADAIVEGDLRAYTGLCAEDIHWMFPGRDIVTGHAEFFDAQSDLARGVEIRAMQKRPVRIERSGELAVEVGRQAVTTADNSPRRCSRWQKYTHILRRTPHGWRFAVLMSNPCE